MSTITLTAQIEDGKLHLYPESLFNNWVIKQNQDFDLAFELYEFPEGGGKEQFVKRFHTAESAVLASKDLT